MIHIDWPHINTIITPIYNTIFVVTAVFAIILVIQQKGEPQKTISWILIIILFPIVGIILYFFFGKNHRKQKIFSRKGLKDIEAMRSLNYTPRHEQEVFEAIRNPNIRSRQHIMKLLSNNSKSVLTQFNKMKILNNGTETFDEIFKELDKARDHIHLEYYVIEEDKIGNRIKEALIRKAKEGIKVRLIYDDVGSWELGKSFLNPLREAGVEVYPFLPVRFIRFASKINYRNHRKIIVIDGYTGFVGGLNIADRYIEGMEELGTWRDTMLKIEGEAVLSLQQIFLSDWYFVSDQIIKEKIYFPACKISESRMVQITASGPDSDWASIMQVYFSAISTAKKHIYISTPYFIPNESILTALKTAALSGIDVRIMMPLRSDSYLVFRSTLSFVTELLEAGIRVFMYKKGFNHSKLIMVDSTLCSIGTANMDIRSFDQNFEVTALIYDEETTVELESHYLRDLKNSFEFTLDEWEKRHWMNKVKENFARILSPLL